MRCVGPLCCSCLECVEEGAGAGDGRLRKVSPPGTRKLFARVCPIFAILVIALPQWQLSVEYNAASKVLMGP